MFSLMVIYLVARVEGAHREQLDADVVLYKDAA